MFTENRLGEYAEELKKMFESHAFSVVQRSKKEIFTDTTDIYLTDTLGEMGLIYQLAPVVFVGGSLIPFGGQNMLEPMYWSRAVLVGPHAFNFRVFMANGREQNALVEVADQNQLQEQKLSIAWFRRSR